ncbi:hypothetical protein D3C85_1719340 [compost metagenome]
MIETVSQRSEAVQVNTAVTQQAGLERADLFTQRSPCCRQAQVHLPLVPGRTLALDQVQLFQALEQWRQRAGI